MGAILVRIRQDDYFIVLKAGYIEVLAYAGAHCRNYGTELLIGKHLIKPFLFHVQRLAPKRQYSLKASVTALLGAAACGIALNYE